MVENDTDLNLDCQKNPRKITICCLSMEVEAECDNFNGDHDNLV